MAALRQIGAGASRALRSAAVGGGSTCPGAMAAGPSSLSSAAGSVPPCCFSTSVSQSAQKKAKAPVKRKTKIKKNPTTNKTKRRGGGDVAASLSRTNPFLEQKRDMSELDELLPDYTTEANVHNVYAWSRRTLDATRYPDGFGLNSSLTRHFQSMPRPRTLLRPQSLQLFGALDEAAATSTPSSSTSSTILHAPLGSGMSTLLVQAFSYALESGWIVLMLPRALQLVDSSSPYVHSEAQQTFLQPELARSLLERLLAVNGEPLRKIALRDGPVTLARGGGTIEAGTNLADVARRGVGAGVAPDAVQTVLETVLRALVQQRDVPVLLAVDGVQGLFSTTQYRDPDYRPLESYELAVPRALHACLRTEGPGAFGGLQRGAMLGTLSLQQRQWPVSRELAMVHPVLAPHLVEPYARLNNTMVSVVQACKLRIWDMSTAAQLTQSEAGALFDVARKEGGLWSEANDELFMTKLVESGGNVGAFDRSLRGTML